VACYVNFDIPFGEGGNPRVGTKPAMSLSTTRHQHVEEALAFKARVVQSSHKAHNYLHPLRSGNGIIPFFGYLFPAAQAGKRGRGDFQKNTASQFWTLC